MTLIIREDLEDDVSTGGGGSTVTNRILDEAGNPILDEGGNFIDHE